MSGIQRFFVSQRISAISEKNMPYIDAVGGNNIIILGGYKIHTFSSVENQNFTVVFSPNNILSNIEYLIVAGGGGGGAWVGGGGGAGGMITGNMSVSATNYNSLVGAGGKGALNPGNYTNLPGTNSGVNGSNSSFHLYTAIGGGRGGSWTAESPTDGGSGGGGTGQGTIYGNGVIGQGNNGGTGRGAAPYECGGGGGAGQVGQNFSSVGGNGGNGLQSSITGIATYYAGGGGGGKHDPGSGGSGGLGGGGNGLAASTSKAGNGTANTGGGGGGNGRSGGERSEAGDGGSGIVVVRYLYA